MPAQLEAALRRTVVAGSGAVVRDALFVHGMLEDEHCWAALRAALDPGRATLGAFPWSARGERYWGGERDIHYWLRAFDQGPVPELVVAHSFGANAVLEYLLANPQRQPRQLVLVAPFYRASRDDVDWDTLMHLAGGLDGLITESIALADPAGRYRGWLLADMIARLKERLGVYGWNEFLQSFLRAPLLPLEQLHCPTLLIGGEHDTYCPAPTVRQLAAALPHASAAILPGCGHFAQITHAAACGAAIRRFVLSSITREQQPCN